MHVSKKNLLFIILLVICCLFLVIYYIIKTKNHPPPKKIACVPDCLKKCNGESDGCGNLCTCPYGNYCKDENCTNDCASCPSGSICDDITGKCKCDESLCPDYQTCQEDETCGYTCLPKCDSGQTCLFDGNCCAQKCDVGQICVSGNTCGCNMDSCKKYSKICDLDNGICKDYIIVVIGVEKNTNKNFICVSSDQGKSWTQKQPTNCNKLSDIAYNESYFVAVGSGVWYSIDNAESWTQNTDNSLNTLDCSGISWCENKNLWFLSVHDPSGNNFCTYSAQDPTKGWSKHSMTTFSIGYTVKCIQDNLIAGGYVNQGPGAETTSILIGTDINNMTVASSSLITCKKIDCNNSGICVAVGFGVNTTIVVSQNTIQTWNNINTPLDEAFCVASNYKGFFVVGGSDSGGGSKTTIMYSNDGKNWNPSDTQIFSRNTFDELGGVFGIASVGDYWFAVGKGSNYSIAVSKDDGKTWVPNTSSVSVNYVLYGIAIKLVNSPCNANKPIDNGSPGSCTSTLNDGNFCEPTCNDGYILTGNRKCNNGILSDTALCNSVNCDVKNSKIANIPNILTSGKCFPTMKNKEICVPECIQGYHLNYNKSALICQNGTILDFNVNCVKN
jgi:hypothetical protein